MKPAQLIISLLLCLLLTEKSFSEGSSVLQDSPTQIENRTGKWNNFFDHTRISQSPTIVNISSSAASFYILSTLQVMYRMAAEPEKDAEMLKNFFTNQVFSPQAFLSISMYSIGVQSANSAFHALAVKNNWIKDGLNIQRIMTGLAKGKNLPGNVGILNNPGGFTPELIDEWKKIRAQAEKSVPGRYTPQRFAKVSLLSSFAIILPLTLIFTDLLSDPDIKYYAESLISSPEKVNQMIREKGITPLEAHERAYQRWVVGNKIADYTPALLSAWTALSIQLFAVPKIVKASGHVVEKFAGVAPGASRPYILKGIQLVRSGLSFIPQGRMASIVGNAVVFLGLNELISYPIKKSYENVTYRKRLEESKLAVDQTSLRPEFTSTCLATLKNSPQYSDSKLNSVPYSTLRKTLLLKDVKGCSGLPPSLNEQLENLSAAYSKWRQLHLSDKMDPLNAWASHTAQALSDYASSEYLYRELVQAAKVEDRFLRHHDAFYGLGTVESDGKSSNTAKKLAEIIKLLNQQSEVSKTTLPPVSAIDKRVISLYKKMSQFLSVLLSTHKKPDFLTRWLEVSDFSSNPGAGGKSAPNRLIEIYSGNAFLEFRNFLKREAKELSDYQRYEFDKLTELARHAEPKAPGEFWIETLRHKLLNSPLLTYPQSISVDGFSVRNNFEYILTQAFCSNSQSAKIESIPFWSMQLALPSVLTPNEQIDCSQANQFPIWPSQQRNIFNSGLESEFPRYVNVFELGVVKLATQIKKSGFNFESWWQSHVGAPADKEFKDKAESVRMLYESSIRPSLFNSSSAASEEIGLVPSILQEIKLYTDILKKHISNKPAIFEAYWSAALTVSVLVKNTDSNQEIMNTLRETGWDKWLPNDTGIPSSMKERYLWLNHISLKIIESARKHVLENTDVSALSPDQQVLLLQAHATIESRIVQLLEISKFPLLFSIQNKDAL